MIKKISVICMALWSANIFAQQTNRLFSDCDQNSCEIRNSSSNELYCSVTLNIAFHSPTLGHISVIQREAATLPKYTAYKIIPISKSYPDIAFSNMSAYADCYSSYQNRK